MKDYDKTFVFKNDMHHWIIDDDQEDELTLGTNQNEQGSALSQEEIWRSHGQMFSKGHKKVVLQSQGRTIVDAPCEICTKLTQIRERVINVREASIKSLIWSLKVNTAVLHNEPTLSSWDSPTLLHYYTTTAKSIHQISGLLQVLWRYI